ncbi:unnamed protein product [Ceratitis capitata]|uniref:(Mediterranean fruit fly) hypothetical protein n=1 Tax=Ceratitis capitata TaxID=7213 RepID=A0A811UWN0_CERCA|nr:unnamed protein product [Ceratitis capitata]
MGVEKNGCETRIVKTNSIDLYRPPALRNYNLSADTVDANIAVCEKSGSVNAATTAPTDAESSCAATAIGKATLISTSISCNNSPTYANESNNSFDNNTVTSRSVSRSDDVVTPTVTTTLTTTALMNHSESSGSDMTTKPTAIDVGVSNTNGQQRLPSAVRRERRPDRAVYIPRARRSQTTPPTTPAPTFGEVKGIHQPQQNHHQRHEQANASTSMTASLAPMPSTTVNNNGSSGGSDGCSNQQQQFAITSETRELVYTKASAKLDDISGEKSTGTAVANSVGKKSKSSNGSSRERRERSKKSTSIVEGQEAKITKLSLDRKETKLQQKQQQQDDHESDVLGDTLLEKRNLITQIQQRQEYQQNFDIENTQQRSSSSFYGQQESIGQEIQTEIIVNNEMNSKSVKRTKVKKHNSSNVGSTNKVQNLRIEDVASTENGTINTATKCDIEVQEFQRASKEINRSNRRIIKQTFVSDVLEIPEKIENTTENDTVNQKSPNNILQLPVAQTNRSAVDSTTEEEEEDDWETMYDDSGECLDPKIVQELTASVGKVKIELPKMDYSAYLTKQSILNDEEFPHVLEVSNFPVEFKNHDLLMVFSQYKESGFDIKWVDDTHALAVFSSSRIGNICVYSYA